jgi:triosephosphate isomerase
MRKPIIAGNWKMFKRISEAIELVEGLKRELREVKEVEVVVCPPFTALAAVGKELRGSVLKLGAQDMFWETQGAYTGEVSPEMLQDVGCEFVIIGHSERRELFHETNLSVNKKVKSALKNSLVPIMCIGEKLEEREAGETFSIVHRQLEEGLQGLTAAEIKKIIIAYEPVWAIGTGRTATPEQAEEVHAYIRTYLTKKYSAEVAESLRIQYGGSVKPENIASLIQEPNIDGALVGGASLKVETFSQIVLNAI